MNKEIPEKRVRKVRKQETRKRRYRVSTGSVGGWGAARREQVRETEKGVFCKEKSGYVGEEGRVGSVGKAVMKEICQ